MKEHHPSALLNDEETDGQNNDSLIAKLKKQLYQEEKEYEMEPNSTGT